MARTTMQQRMLSALIPADLAEDPQRWQQQKSARTRQKLIEAGIACLLEGGYAGLTTHKVSARTGVSRGQIPNWLWEDFCFHKSLHTLAPTGLGVTLYVSGMMVSAFAIRGLA